MSPSFRSNVRVARRFVLLGVFALLGVTGRSAAANPTMVVLLDQSGGMTSSCGSTDCWEAARDAITATLPVYASQVDFGLVLFTGDGGAGCPALSTVAPAVGTGAAIDALLGASAPDGQKPLGDAIAATVPLLVGATGPRTIITVFRATPDTCAQPAPNQGESAAVAAATVAYDAGVRVVAVNLGSTSAPFLQDLANAGVGLAVGGGSNAQYFVATSTPEVSDALAAAIEGGLAAPVPGVGSVAAGLLTVLATGVGLAALRRRQIASTPSVPAIRT